MNINVHKLDLASLCSLIVGIASLVSIPLFSDSLTTLAGPYAKDVLAALALAGLIASQVLRIIGSPSGGGAIPPQSPATAPDPKGN